MSDDNFRKLDVRSLFSHPVYLEEIRIKFVYDGHRVKVKVKRATKVENPYSQCKTLICNDSGSIKHRAMNFASSTGFSTMADRMV